MKLVDVGNGFPDVLEMMVCGYFRLFELVVWLFIVFLSVISGHFRLFELVVWLFIVFYRSFSAIFGYFGSSFGHFWLYYQFPINIPPLI